MPVHNADIAAVFIQIADLLEIEGSNPFRVRAYRNAARMIGEYASALVARLRAVPGVKEAVVAGSYRRARDTVGDLDILVTAEPGSAVMEASCAYDDGADYSRRLAMVRGLHARRVERQCDEIDRMNAGLRGFLILPDGARRRRHGERRFGRAQRVRVCYLDYGVAQARRGWLSAAEVVNTRALPALRKLVKRTM
jgi:hypothetical protein